MAYKFKKTIAAFVLISLAFAFGGCSNLKESSDSKSGETSDAAIENVDSSDMFTTRDLDPSYDESTAIKITLSDGSSACESSLVTIFENTITITHEGVYLLSGTLTNGQIIVQAEKTDKIQLVLNSVNINCNTSAPVYIKQADKVFLTLAGENKLSNKEDFVMIDDNNIDSVIFSKEDLTLNGSGSLLINAAYGHGIVSKDDLVFAGGEYKITAASHAITGQDSVRVADGSFTISSGKDGIHSENTDDTSLGFVYIEKGAFNITSQADGLDASSVLQIQSGTFKIESGGGSANAQAKQEEFFGGGRSREDTTSQAAQTTSAKGIKANGNLLINNGTFNIDSADDSLHSNSNLSIKNAALTLASGDDAMHADADLSIQSGTINITKSYEGIEGQTINILAGTISVVAEDDGLNAAGGNDQSGFGGGMRQDTFAADENAAITISGGVLNINASGDGIDSNGNLNITGGEIYVSGPTNGGNGALDYNGDAQISGGVIVAVGSSAMAEGFGDSSTQGAMLVNFSNQTSGEVILKNSSGEILLTYSPEKVYNSVVISCPEIKKGETYTLIAAGEEKIIEMANTTYSSSGNAQGGAPGGGQGGRFNGARPFSEDEI